MKYRASIYRDVRWRREVEFDAPGPERAEELARVVMDNMHVLKEMGGWVQVDSDLAHGVLYITEIAPEESMGMDADPAKLLTNPTLRVEAVPKYQYRIVTRSGGGDQKGLPAMPGFPAGDYVYDDAIEASNMAKAINRAMKSPILNPNHVRATFQVRREQVSEASHARA